MITFTQKIIKLGQITVQSDNKLHPYILRLLDKNDSMAIMQLQNSVLAATENKEFCVPIPEDELQLMLEGNGESLGLFIQDKLYAVCSLLFKVDYQNNMARELDFTDDQLLQVAQLELSLVDPELRGHKLQYKMARILAQRTQEINKSRYLFTTVSPYNYPSIQTVTSLGLQIARLCTMYYDWDRYVVYKDLTHPIKLDTANPINISNKSFAEQQQLLNNGYRGFSQFKDKDGFNIMFAKMI